MKQYLLPILLALCANCQAQYMPQVMVLTDATIIDADHQAPLKHQTIIINKGSIAEIFTTGTNSLPDTATIINLSGKYVLPGLIDAHVHIWRQIPAALTTASIRWMF